MPFEEMDQTFESLRCPICGTRAEIGKPIELGLVTEQNVPIRSLPVTCKEQGTKFVPYDPGQAPGEAEIQRDHSTVCFQSLTRNRLAQP
jgi:hypothetical protein